MIAVSANGGSSVPKVEPQNVSLLEWHDAEEHSRPCCVLEFVELSLCHDPEPRITRLGTSMAESAWLCAAMAS